MSKITIVETDAQGGLIHFAYHLADAFAEHNCETTLVTGQDYELADLPHRFHVANILKFWPQFDRTTQLGKLRSMIRRVWRGLVLLREWTRLTVHLLRNKPDIAIFGIMRFPMLVIFLKILRLSGINLTQICHEFEKRDETPGLRHRIEAWMYAATYRQFDHIFFLSQKTREDFLKVYPDQTKTGLLPHPPQSALHSTSVTREELEEDFGIGSEERVVLFFGLLRPSKGVGDLLEAFARLEANNNCRLVICGYPNKYFDTDALRARADELGVQSRVTFRFEYLPIPSVTPLLERADVVVFPYRNATASGALALAQSLGRPVIATAVSGLAEAIEDRKTGLLVGVEDIDAIAKAITEIIDDPEFASSLGSAAMKVFATERSWSVVADEILVKLNG